MILFNEQQGKSFVPDFLHSMVLSVTSKKQLFLLILSAVDSLLSGADEVRKEELLQMEAAALAPDLVEQSEHM